jgi:hypothetical protein
VTVVVGLRQRCGVDLGLVRVNDGFVAVCVLLPLVRGSKSWGMHTVGAGTVVLEVSKNEGPAQ